jgi:hypothetical protein
MSVNRRAPKKQDVTISPAVCDVGIEKFKKHDVAIDALISGETITNAALIAGVRRETLSRWLHGNPVFIAKYNRKKNELRHESIACINSIVVQSAAALKIALRHPDINPTAVVQSIMSMLPKMYAALLEHGDEETDPTLIMLGQRRDEIMGRRKILTNEPTEEMKGFFKRVNEYLQARMDVEEAEENPDMPPEQIKVLAEKALELFDKGAEYQNKIGNISIRLD